MQQLECSVVTPSAVPSAVRVLLLGTGISVVLMILAPAFMESACACGHVPSPAAATVFPIDETRVLVRRSALDELIKMIEREVRVRRVDVDEGPALELVHCGGGLRRLGLRDGDRVLRVNGVSLAANIDGERPAAPPGRLVLELLRDGQAMAITYVFLDEVWAGI